MDGAVYRGANPGGVDYVCGVCRKQLLAENVVEDEILDLAFKCRACGGLSASPRLQPGEPLPQPIVALEPGQYRLTQRVDGKPRVTLAGTNAVRRRAKETGANPDKSGKDVQLRVDGASELRGLIGRAKDVLGPVFETLAARDGRGKAASRTPPKMRHRIMELIDEIETSARSFESGDPSINATALVELQLVLDLFARWHEDPGTAKILDDLENPAAYAHAIVTLAAASFLTDAGNGVGFGKEGAHGERIPDLWVATGGAERVAIEVKAPLDLQNRTKPLTENGAKEIVVQCLRKAHTGPKGQLNEKRPGILLLGGFNLSRRDLELLERAATREAKRKQTNRRHIMGIAVLSVGVLMGNVHESRGVIRSTDSSRLVGVVTVRLSMNPNYTGTIKLSEEVSPALRPVDESKLREIDWGRMTERRD